MAWSGLMGTPQSDVDVGMVTGKVLQFPSCLYLMPEKILNNIVSLYFLLHNPHRLCGAFRCTGVQNLIGLEFVGKPLKNLLKVLHYSSDFLSEFQPHHHTRSSVIAQVVLFHTFCPGGQQSTYQA